MLNNLNLSIILKTWRIWWAPNNVCKWRMGFNSSFKGYECEGSPPWSHTDNSCSDPFTAGAYIFIAIPLQPHHNFPQVFTTFSYNFPINILWISIGTALKIKIASSSETLVPIYQSTRRHVPITGIFDSTDNRTSNLAFFVYVMYILSYISLRFKHPQIMTNNPKIFIMLYSPIPCYLVILWKCL